MPLELSYQEAEELLEIVVNNKKLVRVTSVTGDTFVILSYPTSNEILLSRHTREKALIEATKAELPSREEITKVIEDRGMIDREAIEELQNKIF